MKKTMIAMLALLIMLPAYSFAQKGYAIDKGVIVIEGSAYFESMGGDLRGDERATAMSISPGLGYFIMPHLMIGGFFSYYKYSHGDHSDSIFGVGPMAAYFLGNPDSKMYPFVSGSFIYTSDDEEYTSTDIKFKGGAAFMIHKHVAITGGVFYMMESYKPDGADESTSGNTFGIEFGISTFIY